MNNKALLSRTRKMLPGIIAACMVLCSLPSLASGFLGGEITYLWMGALDYRVRLNYYADCSAGGTMPDSMQIKLGVNESSLNQAFWVYKVDSVVSGTELCPSSQASNICNGGSVYNYHKYGYEASITIPAAGEWLLVFDDCCRNSGITNLVNPASTDVRLITKLAQWNSAIGANSCSFSQPAVLAIPMGVTQELGWATDDRNNPHYGLGLSHILHYVRTATGSGYANFQPGYSYIQPFGGVNTVEHLNNNTVTIRPPTTGMFTVSMRITDTLGYNTNLAYSEVQREMTLQVYTLSNQLPQLTGYNGGSTFDTTVIAGTPLTFTFNSDDADTGQLLKLYYGSEIPGSSFSQGSGPYPVGTFTWTPTNADAGLQVFSVRVEDNNCPYYGEQVFTYTITVRKQLSADAGPDRSVCAGAGGATIGANPPASGGIPPYTYLWSPTTGLSDSTASRPTATPSVTTVYHLTVTDSLGTTAADSVMVNTYTSPVMLDSLVTSNPPALVEIMVAPVCLFQVVPHRIRTIGTRQLPLRVYPDFPPALILFLFPIQVVALW